MLRNRRSPTALVLGAVLALGGGPAAAHYVTGVQANPALPVVGETVTLTVEGQFSDGCSRSTSATAQAVEHRILVSILVDGPGPGVYCPAVIVPFAQEVQVTGLATGNYIIDVELFVSEFGQNRIQFFPDVAELLVHSLKQRYRLRPGSWFMDDCPVCTSIPVELPMSGSFDLLTVGPGDVFDFYSICGAVFEAEGYRITGSGRYQISPPPIAGLQIMQLEVTVNNETGIVMESDPAPLKNTAPFPEIDIELSEQTTSISRVYRMRILAAPVNAVPCTDLDQDGDVDRDDSVMFQNCMTGPACGPPAFGCEAADFDGDGDIDQTDFGILQRCHSGADNPADPNCAD